MRALVCACGEHLAAADDAALFRLARAHADRAHPELQLTDVQLHRLLALDAFAVPAPTRPIEVIVVRPRRPGRAVPDRTA